MGLRFYMCGVIVLFVMLLVSTATGGSGSGRECDFFGGSWVVDEAYPLYDAVSSCPFIEREFSCQKNGRPDSLYTKYKWKPLNCHLQGFDGKAFLEKFRGKSIMFVGDSLSRNQWQSLTCMLHSSLPGSNFNITRQGEVSTFTLTDYGVDVKLDRNVFLVDVVLENAGRVLKLDSIQGGKLWKGNHILVFNTWHWWNRRGPSQPWDFIQIGDKLVRDMDRLAAFEKALRTWAGWVEANVDPADTLVFFQGISPSHYNGTLWNEPKTKSCVGQEQPLAGSTYPGGLPPAVDVVKNVLGGIRKAVTLLDITLLSLLRKDGHPSIYGLGGPIGMDCSHWCLAGVPDTWNEILYNYLI